MLEHAGKCFSRVGAALYPRSDGIPRPARILGCAAEAHGGAGRANGLLLTPWWRFLDERGYDADAGINRLRACFLSALVSGVDAGTGRFRIAAAMRRRALSPGPLAGLFRRAAICAQRDKDRGNQANGEPQTDLL
jgi:hypothetical protein